MEDHKIIDLYWARSQQAIVESDQKYGPYCRAIALGILAMREDAEECVNDTWLRAWNAMPPQRPSVLSAFFGKLTRNLSLDRWRRERPSGAAVRWRWLSRSWRTACRTVGCQTRSWMPGRQPT